MPKGNMYGHRLMCMESTWKNQYTIWKGS